MRYPVLEKLGHLPPEEALAKGWRAEGFELGSFANGASYPKPLLEFLIQTPYEPHDFGNMGLLFANNAGVSLHVDEYPSVLWVLAGDMDNGSHTLIVGRTDVQLAVGDVYLFDSRKRHGVIACNTDVWCIFSTYVRRRRVNRKSFRQSTAR